MSDQLSAFRECFNRFQLESVASDPTMQKETFADYVRFVGPGALQWDNTLLSPNLRRDSGEIDRLIDEQINFFRGLKKNFEWKIYDFNASETLESCLLHHGFQLWRENPLMFAPASLQIPQSAEVEVVKVSTPAHFEEIRAVHDQVYPRSFDFEAFLQNLAREAAAPQSRLDLYVARIRGTPACAGWVRHYGEISFYFGGATVPELRGQGAYRALVQCRAREARRRGSRYVISECSPDSTRVLQAVGFEKACNVRVYNFTV